jgi:type IV pilus assembly protein PilV
MKLRTTLPSRPNRKRVSGFTLVEVLIALIIMSVGMLGIAGLYVHSLQAGSTSLFRHNAVTLAGDIADRIRANPRAGATYAAVPGANNNCINGGVDCTRDEMAANDVFLWLQQAAATLPNDGTLPNGPVQVIYNNAVSPPEYQITVSWTQTGEVLTYSITIPVLGI